MKNLFLVHKFSEEPIKENKPYIFDSMMRHYNECRLFITFSVIHAYYKENETNVFRK